MVLDDYRQDLFQKITACRNERAAKLLIEDADSILRSWGIGANDQLLFWYSLKIDLDTEKVRADRLLERQAADSLSQVIAACQAAIAQHQARITGGK